jgi:diguanylate cyclase (GGDEF)-like protein
MRFSQRTNMSGAVQHGQRLRPCYGDGANRPGGRWRLSAFLATAMLTAALLLASPVTVAQPIMSVVRVGASQGLSAGAVMAILQDRRGFLWLGTEDGLNRYDGYELRHYVHRRDDADSLPSNWISALAEDDRGRLWIATDSSGLMWRDPASGQFRRPLSGSGQPLLDPQAQIRRLYVDRRQRLWIGTRGAGLLRLDAAGTSVQEYRRDPTDPGALGDDAVFALDEDSGGSLWVGTGSGLDRLDPDSGRATHYGAGLQRLLPAGAAPIKVNAVLAESRDAVWVGTDSGLFRLDVPRASLTRLAHAAGDEESLPSDRVTALLEDDERRLWVGTTAGLAMLDRRSGRFSRFVNEPANADSLPDNYVVSLYQDRSGLLWVGTKSGGLARWNPRSWKFGHVRLGDSARNNIAAFATDSHGALWIGSFGGGVTRVDPRSGRMQPLVARPGARPALPDAPVMALVVDDRDRLWLGTMGAGVQRLDPRSGAVRRFSFDAASERSLPASSVMSLMRGARGTIWVGTYGGGLASIDPHDERVTRYPVSQHGEAGLSSDRATALAEDDSGLIWIGTDGGGLNVYDPATGRFRHFRHDPGATNSLSGDTIYALYADMHGSVWVGTRGGGLDRVSGDPFSQAAMQIDNVSQSDGLPNNTIYGIVPDSTGRLWLSTNQGIAVFDPANRAIHSFRRSHGLQGDEFNFGAHYRSEDGTVYFGGPNGYNAFQPERLLLNRRPPPVALTEVLKVNTPVASTPETLGALQLGYRDSLVTFRFAALDFTGPQENRYQYRLEGFDDRWIDAGNLGQANYTNLGGGHYTFRVRAANSDGVWNEDGLAVALQVAPPPWSSWWARTLYVLAALGVVLAVWYAQRRRTEREAAYARRLRVEVDERTAEIAAQNRAMEAVNQQLHQASVTDPLTGLGNRRHLCDSMAALGAAELAAGNVLMIVDLDFMKPINDQHGHHAGDAVLCGIAGILRQLFRSTDLIVRWGGDEFVVFCRGCDLGTASALAERVRSAVAKTVFRVADGATARTSCSIGFATVPFVPQAPQLLGWEQSMSLADAALYQAKRERNTWFGWSGLAPAAQLPSLLAAIDADAAALERSGTIDVRRRPSRADDTVDHVRALNRMDAR